MDAYFQNAKPNQVVAILKAREPARILVAIGNKENDSPHLEYKQRWVNQFNFYVHDARWEAGVRTHVSICVAFLKLFEKIYAPLNAGLLQPFRGDRILTEEKRCELDRLYQHVSDDLDALFHAVGLKIAA